MVGQTPETLSPVLYLPHGGGPFPILGDNGHEKMVSFLKEIVSKPDLFIPTLVELYQQGRFPFDKLVKFYPLDQINQAAEDSEKGITIKPIIRL